LDSFPLYISPLYLLICFLSPEINLALLLYIGRIGYEPRLQIFEPFSLNHLNLLIFAFHYWKSQRELSGQFEPIFRFFKPYLPFILYLGLNALLLSHHPDYALRKLISLAGLGVLAVMYLQMRYRIVGRTALARTLTAIAFIAFAMSGLAFFKIMIGISEARLTVLQGGPIVLGRINGFAILMLAGYYFYTDRRKLKVGLFIIGTLIFFTQLWTLSKGPVLALYLTLIIEIYLFSKTKKSTRILLATLAMVLILVFTFSCFQLDTRFFMNPFAQSPENTYHIRWMLFVQAFENIRHHLFFGTGLGNFMDNSMVYGVLHRYPHNLILEIFAETGLLGFVLLLKILYDYFHRMWRYLKDYSVDHMTIVLLMLGLYMFLNQMVSGDLTAGRFLWYFLIWGTMMMDIETQDASNSRSSTEPDLIS